VDVPLWENVTVIFSKSMNPGTLLWNIDPDPTGWTETWSTTFKTDDTVTFEHSVAFEECTPHMFTISYVEDTVGNPLDPLAGKPNPWNFTTVCIQPYIETTDPYDTETNVEVTRAVKIDFSEPINTTTFSYNIIPDPDPFGWTWIWSGGNTTITGTHVDFDESTTYNFTVNSANDEYGNPLTSGPVPNPWEWSTLDATNPWIDNTAPFHTETGVAMDQTIQIIFSEEIDTSTFLWDNCSGVVGGWNWNWLPGDLIAQGTHDPFTQLTTYTCEVLAADDLAGNPLVAGPVPNPFWFETESINPVIVITDPPHGAAGVPVTQLINITFSQPMNTASFVWDNCSPDPGGWSWVWFIGDTIITGYHNDFAPNQAYTCEVLSATNKAGDPLIPGPVPNPWTFTTGLVDLPSNLRVLRSPPSNVVLNWDAVTGATLYNIYETQNNPDLWPWPLLDTSTTEAYSHNGALTDGLTHYYIVRAVAGGNETGNSTMGVKTELSFVTSPPGMTDINWMSLPYDSDYTQASDITNELGSGKITSVGKWDRVKHKVVTYSFLQLREGQVERS